MSQLLWDQSIAEQVLKLQFFLWQEKGNRPIHVAARAGQVGQVELLVVWGADPGAFDSAGNTPSACARSVLPIKIIF